MFGYETGPSLINQMGLTTQVPKYAYYATNKNRTNKRFKLIKLVKPVVEITKENFKYLQILDIIQNKYKVPFEAKNPYAIIREVIENNNMEFEKLLYYSTFYKGNSIYKEIVKVMNEDS